MSSIKNEFFFLKVVRDRQLFGMLAGMVLIDVITLTAWQIRDPLENHVDLHQKEVSKTKPHTTYASFCFTISIYILLITHPLITHTHTHTHTCCSSPKLTFKHFTQNSQDDDDIVIQPFTRHCRSQYITIWTAVLLSYKGNFLFSKNGICIYPKI